MKVRLMGLAGLAVLALIGCAESNSSVKSFFKANRATFETRGNERVFSVTWWARADEGFLLPYKPVETGEPEVDSKTGHVFVGTADGKVRAFDAKGRWLWEFEAGCVFDAGPTAADGRLFVGTTKGQLICLDAASGKKIWEYDAHEELITKPSVSDGLVLVASTNDTVYAVDEVKGEWKWQYRRDAPGDFTVRGASRPMLLEGRVFAGFADGYAVALDAKDGALQWAKDLGQGKPFADVDAGPAMDEEGRVYFASYATGIFALEAGTGKLIWTSARPGVSALALSQGGKRLYSGGNGFIAAYQAADGVVSWSNSLGTDRFVSGMAIVNNLVLAATGQGPLLFLDGGTGTLRRTFDPGRGIWAAPSVRGAQAYVLSNRGVVYDLGIEARGRP